MLKNRFYLTIVAAVFAVASHAGATAPPLNCPRQPIEPCVIRHGRLSSQNGIALTIWLIGTTRRVEVVNGLAAVPSAAWKYLEMTAPEHSYVYGDFEICPVEPEIPGHIRQVCVASGKNLVVADPQASRPAFRLKSTWSTTGPNP